MNWTAGAESLLRELWPNYSASTIARRLGTTKSSVIGKAHRMELSAKPPSAAGYDRNTRGIARGYHQPNTSGIGITIYFDEETFLQIRDRAAKAQTSFSAEVRQLVEWGLLDAEEAAA